MPPFKTSHRLLSVHGRILHFASYGGRSANLKRCQLPYPAMWYLLVEGRRCPVLPYDATQTAAALDDALHDWAADNALGPVEHAFHPVEG
jgi:hypothetical protein